MLREGESADGLYLLVAGSVEVTAGDAENRSRIAVLRSGEFFGVNAAATGDQLSATVTATEQTTLLVMSADRFQHLLEVEPSVKAAVETVRGMRRLVTDALFHGRTDYAEPLRV